MSSISKSGSEALRRLNYLGNEKKSVKVLYVPDGDIFIAEQKLYAF